ncbi:MAG TPA: bifunctional phosphoribosylaminoimidazolecarboxamide formyltransferase/IMP cyclohydrolase [Nitrospiria bacterium]|nr:bifunctional phosphoribosylaminoimidazolecarboxamide formyltransferase/IMP cyclohydrolase [Nitrospiria bacterium]
MNGKHEDDERPKKITRALLSVSNKEGLAAFAKALSSWGVELISTGGTARLLREQGLTVRDVAEVTGSPELFGGRVKTLHPKIHGGLLALRNDPEHQRQMREQAIAPIDLVVVNLYPFEDTVRATGSTPEEIIEQIDIGGPSMVRSAAKNHRDVAVVVDPADYERVSEELDALKGALRLSTRRRLARKAFALTARYDSVIAHYFGQLVGEEGAHFPPLLHLQFEKVQHLRYGENPHQLAAFYREIGSMEPSVAGARQLQGKELSFNNLLDSNAALELVKEFPSTATVIIKHNNPCGVATGEQLVDSYRMARATDPVSAFGGVIAFNETVDEATAKELASTFVEVVIAPDFSPEAQAALKAKTGLRLLAVGPLGAVGRAAPSWFDFKRIVGGLLLQERDLGRLEDVTTLPVATTRRPTGEEYEAMAFAWIVAKHVKSNAIVYARPGRTIGIGAGQMSRVDSVRLGAMKAQSTLAGSVMASDAFFPFRDGIDEAAKHGVTAIIQPGGSIRDEEVITAANEHGLAMIITGMRHFRH